MTGHDHDRADGYVATTALFAWCTFFAVVAPCRPRPLASMSFWFGLGLDEVPFVGLYMLVGSRHWPLPVYRRRDAPQNAPVLIYFHGGHYTSGAKNREARPLLYRLASQGWVCISANYRLRPQTTFPGHQIDAKKVIAWAREHAAAYGADPSRLFVAGSSAGSNLAGLCALTPNDPMFQPGFESADTSVTAAICLYGYYGHYFGDPPDEPPSPPQPQGYIHPGAPPFLIAHGTKDALATVEGARNFVGRLRRVSDSAVVYAELPGGQHAFDVFHSPRFEAVVDGVEAFAAWVLAAPQRTPDSAR